MAKFKAWVAVTTGTIQEIGSSPFGVVSLATLGGAAGTVGIIDNLEAFVPHPDGVMATNTMLTFEVGKGRRLAFSPTADGFVSTAEV